MRVDWQRYARRYDLLLEHNPAYQQMLERLLELFGFLHVPPGTRVLDLGAGTGNLSTRLAHLQPDCTVLHLDRDEGMLKRARQKAAGLNNLQVVQADASTPLPGCDVVFVVHALYTFPEPLKVLQHIHTALTVGGTLLVCDLGRPLNLLDWAQYLFREISHRHGVLRALQVFWEGREITRQNRQIRKNQLNGTYWTHTAEELQNMLEQAGFQVVSSEGAYRNYSDLVVARKTRPERRA